MSDRILHVVAGCRRARGRLPCSPRCAPAGSHRSAPMSTLSSAKLADRVGVAHGVALQLGHRGAAPRAADASASSPATSCVTSTMTFAATANAIVYTGAEPYFVDCRARDRQHGPGSAASRRSASCAPPASGSPRSCRSTCSARPPTTRASCRSPTSSTSPCSPMPRSRSAPRHARPRSRAASARRRSSRSTATRS